MKKLLMGMTCYGSYLDTFLYHCLPSLLAEGNLPTLLKERFVSIVIHTDAAGHALLMKRFPFPEGVEFELRADVDKGIEKYEQLGLHQSSDLREAKRIGADYHCLMPDFIYSNNCFANVLKSGHKTITRLVVSTKQEEMVDALAGYAGFGKLSISAQALATLSLKYMHPGVKCWLATKEGYPKTHVIAWEGQNTLHMCSPHQTVVYLANEVINPIMFNLPLDCVLDHIVIGDVYCPKPKDEIVIVEMSSAKCREPNDDRVDLNEFCRIMNWDTGKSIKQVEIFNQETIDPIYRPMLGDTWWNDVEIAKSKQIVYHALKESIGG